MLDEKKAPSKMRTFRFNDAMEKDLYFLMELWGCTATDALARALTNVTTLERMYIVQTTVNNGQTDKRAVWETEMKHRIYGEPLASIQSLSDPASGIHATTEPEDTAAPDELPTIEPVAPIQTQTAAEIEKPTPSTPIIKGVAQMDTRAKDTAGNAAASTDDEGSTRYQVKILVHDDPKYSKRPKATSGQTAESAEEKAVAWLRGRGYYDIDPKIPAGQHCTTIKI